MPEARLIVLAKAYHLRRLEAAKAWEALKANRKSSDRLRKYLALLRLCAQIKKKIGQEAQLEGGQKASA